MKKEKNKNFIKAFTLVELIIVITILAILATISFISFQGYSKNTRDSSRLTTLKSIEDGLNIYQNKTGKYPEVDNSIQIQSSGGIILGYQGYFGDNNSRVTGFSKTPTDPFDNSKYIYSTNALRNKFQIMGFLENNNSIALLNQAYADNSSRIPKTRGNNLGIILDTNNNPITTNIDIENTSSGLKVYLSDNYKLEGTGTVIKSIISTLKDGKQPWTYYDKNCNLPDVVIGTQTWAGCNSTLGYGFEWGQMNDGTDGTIFGCYSYNTTNTPSNCPKATTNNNMYSNKTEKSWTIASTNSGTVDNIWGKLYTWTGSTGLNENCKGGDFSATASTSSCPCPNGWHIPTDNEWTTLSTTLNGGSVCETTNGWQCSGLGWLNNNTKTVNNNIIQALKIPLAGYREIDNRTFNNRGSNAYLWSSSINVTNAYLRLFQLVRDGVGRDKYNSNYGFSVRCLKD